MSIRALTLPVLAGLLALGALVAPAPAAAVATGRVNVVVRAVDGVAPVHGTFTLSGLSQGSAALVSIAAAGDASLSLPAGAYRVQYQQQLSAGVSPHALEGLTTPRVLVVAPSRTTLLIAELASNNALLALAD
jgi:hypothetical protein